MEYKAIKEIANINSENINKEYREKYIMYLDTSNITKGKIEEIVKIDISNAPSRAKRIVRENDIIYSTVRPNLCHYGILRNVVDNMIVSTGFAVIRCDYTKIVPEYLYAYLTLPNITKKMYAIAETSTSAYPSIKPSDLENVIIPIPSMNIQRKIAKILSNLDKKIELNNQINDNLYEISKQLYKRWFIDYEFPNEDGTTYKSSFGKMIESEIGEIPEGWKIIQLGNYLKVERGLSYKGKFLSNTGILMINLGNIMPNSVFRIEKNKYYSGDFKDKVTTKSGNIVIANTDMTQNREVLGTPVIIPSIYKNDKLIYSHHIYCVKNLRLPKMFVFHSLLTERYKGIVGGSATGTTVLALPKEVIENFKIAIPDTNLLKKFEEITNTIQQKKDNIFEENQKLEQLRDTLLSKLMNGEIDLENVRI